MDVSDQECSNYEKRRPNDLLSLLSQSMTHKYFRARSYQAVSTPNAITIGVSLDRIQEKSLQAGFYIKLPIAMLLLSCTDTTCVRINKKETQITVP